MEQANKIIDKNSDDGNDEKMLIDIEENGQIISVSVSKEVAKKVIAFLPPYTHKAFS